MQRVLCTSICFVVACGFAMPDRAANAAEPPPVQQDRPVPSAGPDVSLPVVGMWIVEFANGVTEACDFRPSGTAHVYEPSRASVGRPVVKDNSVVIVFEDTRVERWTRVGNRHVVEHWFPGSQFPTAAPVRGIAEFLPPSGGRDHAIAAIVQLGGRVSFGDQRALLSVLFEGPRTLTDMYIGNLERVKDLPSLRLVETDVTDAGLPELTRLKNLTHLEFTGRLSDTGLAHLGEMTQLRQLHLQRTGLVTDAGLKHLKGLTNLESLMLTGCKVTDAGLEHLKGMTKLEKLDLSETDVSDAGLEHLQGLTNLRLLTLKRTSVTAAGVERLQEALPECMISHSPRT